MSEQAPTERQLRYLRVLAERTAGTFVPPATRTQASREIERLRGRELMPRERHGHEPPYATAVYEQELTGFGATRTWRSRPPERPASPRSPMRTTLIARYSLSGGERRIEALSSGDEVSLSDVPDAGEGERYTIETLSRAEAQRELPALLADYLRRARELDAIPMSARALELLSGGAGDD